MLNNNKDNGTKPNVKSEEKVRLQKKEYRIGIPDPGQTINFAEEIAKNEFRVSIFGSARSKTDSKEYQDTFELARLIADAGFDLVNGGGPGIMEAASKGHNAGGNLGSDVHTIGLNIELPFEQAANPYLDIANTHATFSTRLDQFMLLSSVFVVAPGGIGTCLELFYTWQLMQVGHICKMPIILMGKMWEDLLTWIKSDLLAGGYISKEDIYPIVVVETPEQAISVIKLAHENFEATEGEACVNIKKYARALKNMDLGV